MQMRVVYNDYNQYEQVINKNDHNPKAAAGNISIGAVHIIKFCLRFFVCCVSGF